MFRLFWTSKDGTGSIPMGEFDTRESAEAAIPAARAELIDQCADDDQRGDIESGRFEIVPS